MSDRFQKAPVAYELRPVRPDDDPFLLRVYADTRADELALVPWTAEQREAFVRMQFEAQRHHYRDRYPEALHSIVLVDASPVGRLYVERSADTIQILDLAILGERRRAGIGSAVLADLLAEATETRRPVRVYVETFNPSLALFERLGFVGREENGVYRVMEFFPAA